MRIAFFLTTVLLVFGCASKKISPITEVKQALIHTETINVEHRKALAQQLFEEQDYYSALTQWRILKTIDPDNAEYINRIRVLETLIKRRIKLYLVKGKEFLVNDELKLAEIQLLKALALDPTDFFALKMMRNIESKRVNKVQIAKTKKLELKQQAKFEEEKRRQSSSVQKQHANIDTEKDQDEEIGVQEAFYLDMGKVLFKKGDWSGSIREIEKYLSSNKSTPSIQSMLFKAHNNMSSVFERRGHWEPAIQHIESALYNANDTKDIKKLEYKRKGLKHKASEYYYVEGVKVYRDNVDKAITYWQQAIAHNSSHENAQNRLTKALKIKRNLDAIQQ